MAQRWLVRSSRVRRVAGPVLVVLVLVAIVTVAATGSTSSGSGTSAPPADTLLDTIFSLLLLLSVAWVAIAVFSLARWREHEWTAPRRRNDLRAIATLIAFGFALALYVRERGWHLTFDPAADPARPRRGWRGTAWLRRGPRPRLPVPVRLAPGRRGARARGDRRRRVRAVDSQGQGRRLRRRSSPPSLP